MLQRTNINNRSHMPFKILIHAIRCKKKKHEKIPPNSGKKLQITRVQSIR